MNTDDFSGRSNHSHSIRYISDYCAACAHNDLASDGYVLLNYCPNPNPTALPD